MTTEEEDKAMRFRVGEVYVATPALKGQPRRLAAIIGREGPELQVAFVDELVAGRARRFEGRDFAVLLTRIGQYDISACVKANAREATIINDILKSQRRLTASND